MHQAHTASGQRLVRAACEVAFLESDRREHPCREIHVLRLAAMGCARQRELLAAPSACIEATRFDKREELKRLRAGAPDRRERGITSAAEQFSIGAANDGVHMMPRFDRVTARGDNVELKVIR